MFFLVHIATYPATVRNKSLILMFRITDHLHHQTTSLPILFSRLVKFRLVKI